MFASGWASVAATYRDLERTETAEKIKEGTVTMIDKSMDGLSKVRYNRAAQALQYMGVLPYLRVPGGGSSSWSR